MHPRTSPLATLCLLALLGGASATAQDAPRTDRGPGTRTVEIYDVSLLIAERGLVDCRLELGLADPPDQAIAGLIADSEELDSAGLDLSPSELVVLIRENIAPASWDDASSWIEADEGRLLVHQTAEVHAQIRALVTGLVARGRQVVRFEAQLIELSDAQRTGLPIGAPLGEAEEKRLEAAVAGGAQTLTLVGESYHAQTCAVAAITDTAYHAGWEVSQVGVTPVVDPKVRVLQLGHTLRLTPFLLDDGRIAITAHARIAEAHGTRPVRTARGRLELPTLRVIEARTAALFRGGDRRIVASVPTPGRPRHQTMVLVRATVEAPGGAAPPARLPAAAGGQELRIYDTLLVTREHLGARDAWTGLTRARLADAVAGRANSVRAVPYPVPFGIAPEHLEAMLQSAVAPGSWDDGGSEVKATRDRLLVRQSAAVHAEVDGFLTRLEGRFSRQVVVEVYAATIAGPGRALSTKALETQLASGAARRLGAVVALDGASLTLASELRSAFIAGTDTVSGGTGQVVETVTVPRVRPMAEGLVLTARPWLRTDGALAAVSLYADLRRAQKAPTPILDGEVTMAEAPRLEGYELENTYLVPLDQPTPLGGGGPIGALVLRVRQLTD